jgi:Lon protease-like protein
LQGLCRFEVSGETGSGDYRQGLIDLKEFERPEGGLPPELRVELLRMVAVVLKGRDEGMALSTLLKQPLPDESLVHNLSFALDFTPLEKQFLLESDSLVQQARRFLDLLQFKQYERNDATGWG